MIRFHTPLWMHYWVDKNAKASPRAKISFYKNGVFQGNAFENVWCAYLALVYTHSFVYVYLYIHIQMCIHVFVYMCIYVHTYMYVSRATSSFSKRHLERQYLSKSKKKSVCTHYNLCKPLA